MLPARYDDDDDDDDDIYKGVSESQIDNEGYEILKCLSYMHA